LISNQRVPASTSYLRRLQLVEQNLSLLSQSLRGVERECLRVTGGGHLAQTPHPAALGSALTNEQITTDYSESLLEFITPALADPAKVLESLEQVHRFVYTKLDGEYLWSPSMPCILPAEEDIPIAEYGTSNVGKFKHVYRKGLALRYGRTMQCIAGIHYNFSLAEALWPLLRETESGEQSDRDYQSAAYFALIRNFRRYSWLLMYLFGASPALEKGFLRGRAHQLEELDAETLYLPYATSLRMSDLGYQSNAQARLAPSLNSLDSYIEGIRKALDTVYPLYEQKGTTKRGEWLQLNSNVLQIENEYYSSIRPKRVAYVGERPIEALTSRGVQYVEVRCLDINPFMPLGIDLTESRFLDAFLLFCALEDSPQFDSGECDQYDSNFLAVAKEGRRPGLELCLDGQSIGLKAWASELIRHIGQLAVLLDRARGGEEHMHALAAQQAKVDDASLTPSAQVLASMSEHNESFVQFSLRQSRLHAKAFREMPLAAEQQQVFENLASESITEQVRLETLDQEDFHQFMDAYLARS
jgi:glutamate--cysteine ligase|tara:strand:- start:2701 stop:4287 length:1587 start_codon:yes stop_codon:yes gene_type:complete